MSYTKTNWTSTTPINTTNLNKIEEGISANDTGNTNNATNIGTLSNLNTTEKSNLVGAINEVNTNDIRRSTYSTDEQVIGTWIDGKPLYRKTITFTTTIKANETTSIAHNITNVKNIFIDFSTSFMEANIGATNYLSYSFPLIGYESSTNDKVFCYSTITNIKFYSNGGWATNWTKHITLKYTKTTD